MISRPEENYFCVRFRPARYLAYLPDAFFLEVKKAKGQALFWRQPFEGAVYKIILFFFFQGQCPAFFCRFVIASRSAIEGYDLSFYLFEFPERLINDYPVKPGAEPGVFTKRTKAIIRAKKRILNNLFRLELILDDGYGDRKGHILIF